MSSGIFSEYLKLNFTPEQLRAERKKQLKRISELRGGRAIISYAANFSRKESAMEPGDIMCVQDQLQSLVNPPKEIDVIIETPGGLAEVAEDIVRIIRGRFESVGMIVPGSAKSAGTIFVMAGDEILMGATSALGPIDPQIPFGTQRFSADAFLEGLDKIKEEVDKAKTLNPAYIPILQGISPAQIQHCHNARQFSCKLVREWLEKYKFKYWTTHSTTGLPVTPDEKKSRAAEIANKLSEHARWLTHARSIRMEDLEDLGLKITDYSRIPDLNDAISRYYTLVRMTLESSNAFKLYETTESQILRQTAPAPSPSGAPNVPKNVESVILDVKCSKCGEITKVQGNFSAKAAITPGTVPYPTDTNILDCPKCSHHLDLTRFRMQIEKTSGKILTK